MTREEKIALLVDELEDIRCDNFDADTDEDKTLKEAVRVIKALEQEKCPYYMIDDDGHGLCKNHRVLEQEPCGDTVSRQAVVDITGLSDWFESSDSYNEFVIALSELPPVTPQPKIGHWRHYEGMLICSECGAEFYDDIMEYCGDDVPKRCPNCGCRMVNPQESDNCN